MFSKEFSSNFQSNLFLEYLRQAEMFCKEEALKIFTKFAGKHLCQSLFLDKVQA